MNRDTDEKYRPFATVTFMRIPREIEKAIGRFQPIVNDSTCTRGDRILAARGRTAFTAKVESDRRSGRSDGPEDYGLGVEQFSRRSALRNCDNV